MRVLPERAGVVRKAISTQSGGDRDQILAALGQRLCCAVPRPQPNAERTGSLLTGENIMNTDTENIYFFRSSRKRT